MSREIAPVAQRAGLATLRDLLASRRAAIAAVLPRHLDADRLVRLVLLAASRTPQLLECTPTSILRAVMAAAQLGVDPSGVLGSGYLVPYRHRRSGALEAQLIVGYRGLIDLARRGGAVASIEARVIHERDEHAITWGTTPSIVHRPHLGADPGEPIAVYAVARLRDGTVQSELMTRAQIEAIRTRSQAGDGGPWVDHWEEMARKTVVRRLCKYLPLSTDLEDAISAEDHAEAGLPLEIDLAATPEAPASTAVAIAAVDERAELLERISLAESLAQLQELAATARAAGLEAEYSARRAALASAT